MLLWATTPPRIEYPLPPPLPVSGNGKAFLAAQPLSRHSYRPRSLHSPQPAPEIHPPTYHSIKRNTEAHLPLNSSLRYKSASSTPVSRIPSPIWLCSFSLLMAKDTATTTFKTTLVFGEEISKGLRQLHLKVSETDGHNCLMSIKY